MRRQATPLAHTRRNEDEAVSCGYTLQAALIVIEAQVCRGDTEP
jgi:hypothetical protein